MTTKLQKLTPGQEVEQLIYEATRQVEDELKLEDHGWTSLSQGAGEVISGTERVTNIGLSRLYYTKDPLAKQAIRLWTDYTFGAGMVWDAEDENTQKVLDAFWNATANQSVLSARGQRKSSDKLLVDGEVFFALFLGPNGVAKIRHINPLEITEIITNPDDTEDVRFYRRQWTDAQSHSHDEYYRDITNIRNEATLDMYGTSRQKTDDAVIYHLTYNTITQRGNPLLLPALDWIKQYRRFLASRVAIMLALARFAWKGKIMGGQEVVEAIKAKTHEKEVKAGSTLLENLGSDTTPIRTDTNAAGAYQDGRMLKLQIAAAVGIPEQYFGDISIGNLATAKTVELPMMKMFQSYQQVWRDAFKVMDEVVLEHNQVLEDKRYVDRDFPPIAPEDVAQAAEAIVNILTAMPELATLPDVQQIALMTLGINDPTEVLGQLAKQAESNPNLVLSRALRIFRETVKGNGR